MKICGQCGTEIFDGEEFCYACGYAGSPVNYDHVMPSKNRDTIALMLAIIPGFFGLFGLFDIYGLGQLYLKRYVRAALFLSLSVLLFLALHLSYVERADLLFMLANSAVFLVQAFDVLGILKRDRVVKNV